VSLRTELTDLSQVEGQSAELYALLQQTVDKELQAVGYLPPEASGHGKPATNGHSATHNGSDSRKSYPIGRHTPDRSENNSRWACSEKQRDLILRVVEDNQFDKNDVERMACDLFGRGVTQLDKMQASQLIEELLEKVGKKPNGRNRWRQSARS
jgi:hypothetical protein